MLHAEIEGMVVGILESGGPDLQVGLLKQGNLLGRILEASEANAAAIAESPANAKGYMGHLLRICNMIISVTDEVKGVEGRGSLNDMTHADSIMEHLEADPVWPKWEEFVKTTVATANEKDRHPLGGAVVSHAQVRRQEYFFREMTHVHDRRTRMALAALTTRRSTRSRTCSTATKSNRILTQTLTCHTIMTSRQ